ncbi:hypothetical protein GH714_013409 [Hevea brasiliensis]|uniref:DUF4219 domain-containing protein n=1 Tax=Hevea brasiliensis TaxID=3981 RepID=A0A6A6LBF2_HEVBR|nr:hypothetical protein GH714_013409 [Hevea brasiliensis]
MASSCFIPPSPPIFSGENYQMRAVKMKAYLKAFDQWDFVETGRAPPPLPDNPSLAQIKMHKRIWIGEEREAAVMTKGLIGTRFL